MGTAICPSCFSSELHALQYGQSVAGYGWYLEAPTIPFHSTPIWCYCYHTHYTFINTYLTFCTLTPMTFLLLYNTLYFYWHLQHLLHTYSSIMLRLLYTPPLSTLTSPFTYLHSLRLISKVVMWIYRVKFVSFSSKRHGTHTIVNRGDSSRKKLGNTIYEKQ